MNLLAVPSDTASFAPALEGSQRESILSHDTVWFPVSERTTSKLRNVQHMGAQRAGSSLQIATLLMAFRIATKDELDWYFSFNDVLHSSKIDKVCSSLLPCLSLLAACIDGFVALLASCTRYVDVKFQNGVTSRIDNITHRGGWRNLDSTAPSRSLPWKSLKGCVENDTALATQCDDVSPVTGDGFTRVIQSGILERC